MTGEIPPPSPGVRLDPDETLDSRTGFDLGRLVADLRSVGVRRGQHLLVHSSLSAVGWVTGGPATLLRALQYVAGAKATIVVPTHTPLTSPTSRAFREVTGGLDQDGIDQYVAATQAFDPDTTPSYRMGRFAEHVRTHPQARRSDHPQTSFAAIGPGAAACTSGHHPDSHLGEQSPLRWLYDADAAILLLGVGYDACTAFHLAEYRVRPRRQVRGADLDDSDFMLLGAELEEKLKGHPAGPRVGYVGIAQSMWVPVRTAVNYASDWMREHRGSPRDK